MKARDHAPDVATARCWLGLGLGLGPRTVNEKMNQRCEQGFLLPKRVIEATNLTNTGLTAKSQTRQLQFTIERFLFFLTTLTNSKLPYEIPQRWPTRK